VGTRVLASRCREPQGGAKMIDNPGAVATLMEQLKGQCFRRRSSSEHFDAAE
jgi:hypothetical protein